MDRRYLDSSRSAKPLYEAPTELQHWLHGLVSKFPNTDHVGRYNIELTGDEVFYIKNLVQTEYMLGFNAK